MKKESSGLAVVLVGPQGPRNIGAVCRVMRNFGYRDLRLVQPACNHRSLAARYAAVRSQDLLDQARVYQSLAAAVADCRLVLGTTRRFGKNRQQCVLPEELATMTATVAGRTALVFGREDNGLTNAELQQCHRFVTIPTDPQLPSMNLAQAVTVCLYETAKARFLPGGVEQQEPPAAAGEVEDMYAHMREVLLAIGYLNPQNPDHILQTYRRIFGRALLSAREVRVLRGLWHAVAVAAKRGDSAKDRSSF